MFVLQIWSNITQILQFLDQFENLTNFKNMSLVKGNFIIGIAFIKFSLFNIHRIPF